MSKVAIARMSEVLAVEWSRYGINVNCIAPGAFESEMMDGTPMDGRYLSTFSTQALCTQRILTARCSILLTSLRCCHGNRDSC